MNLKAAIAVAMAFNIAGGSVALAQGNSDRRNDRGNAEARHDNRDFGRQHEAERSRGRGAGPGQAYYRGDRFPAEYRNRHYVVDDWRSHNLSAPPRGYQWVQSGNDYVMVAIATGIIASLILGR